MPNFELHVFGNYKFNRGPVSMCFFIIIPRIFSLFKIINKKDFCCVVTAHYQANLVAKLKNVKNISIIDDPRNIVLQLIKFSTKDVYLPNFLNCDYGTKIFNGLKEWSYLSPKYFKPNREAIKEYDVNVKKYIFIREVDTNTSNYLSQEKNIILKLSKEIPRDIDVILSLENKSFINNYPSHWKILNEPVKDIHSLMFFSRIVVSTGDSMAREGAMLGVKSIYLGNRDMPANQVLVDKGMLFKFNINSTIKTIKDICVKKDEEESTSLFKQNEYRCKLDLEWDDITNLIASKIKE